MTGQTIKLLAVIEANSVTGPAKNLLEFCRMAASPGAVLSNAPVVIQPAIAVFKRPPLALNRADEFGRACDRQDNAFESAARQFGVKVHTINERFRFDPQVLSGLRDLVTQLGPDIVQTHGVKSHFLMRLSGLWQRQPWIAFHHGYTRVDAKMCLYNQLDRWSLRAADQVITVSNGMARDLARRGIAPERIIVLHNSISAEEMVAVHQSGLLNQRCRSDRADKRIMVSVGRLSREKGHIDLISAIARLKQNGFADDMELILVGDGPQRRALEQAVDHYQLDDAVSFAGQVDDVRPYYEMADLLVLPSHSEGSPNVLLEAMAAGVPVVATRVGGVPDIVKDGSNGLLVEARSPDAFASAIKLMMSNPDLRLRFAEEALETVAKDFSPAARYRLLKRTYLGLAGQPESLSRVR